MGQHPIVKVECLFSSKPKIQCVERAPKKMKRAADFRPLILPVFEVSIRQFIHVRSAIGLWQITNGLETE